MYTYDRLSDDVAYLGYNGIDVGSIGKSTLGYNIPYIHVGDYCGRQIIITAGIHARENVTSLLVIRQAYAAAFTPQYFEGGIYFLPMINPDGAMLIEKGAGIDPKREQKLIEINGSEDFSLWKANINGVDLNNNFDAKFGCDPAQKLFPAAQGYPGKYPFSEQESYLLKQFTLKVRPAATLSYHALGREVYYSFFQDECDTLRDKKIAAALANHLDYKLIDSDMGSTGGYKDWCIEKLKIPAFTIEIISEEHVHPLDISVLEEDWDKNKDIPALLSALIHNISGK